MFKRLRSFLQKPENPPPQSIMVRDLPQWMEGREKSMDDALSGIIAPHREVILSTMQQIRGILTLMEGKDRDPAWHPKVEKIGKTALPHFIRSMQQTLDRSLPSSPSLEFYHEAAGILKSCIVAIKGAGKYLPMIFPDEMRELRHEMGVFGKAVNTMTAELAVREKDQRILSDLREAYTVFFTEESHLMEAKNKHKAIMEQCAGAEQQIAALQKTIEDIKNSPDYRTVEGYERQLLILEKEAREIHLKNEGTLGLILTFYRRADRVAQRISDPGRRVLDEVVSELNTSPLECSRLGEILARSLPVVRGLLERGHLRLKGQEESRFFGMGHSPITEALKACHEISRVDKEIYAVRGQLIDAPVIQRIQQLQQEIRASEEMQDRYHRELHQVGDRLENLPNRLQSQRERMGKILSQLSGGRWQLHDERGGVEKGSRIK